MAESASGAPAMLALRDHIIAVWVSEARAALSKADALSPAILQNTLSAFYERLVAQMEPSSGAASDVAVIAQEHGGERARLSGYDTTTLIREYQLFRQVVLRELSRAGIQLGDEQRIRIDNAFDSAIRESVTAFAMIQSALREQFIAAITHDLRAPLSSASIAAQLIEQKTIKPEVRQLARRIIANNQRIDNMTRDLLDNLVFNHGEKLPLNITEFDMAELVLEVVHILEDIHKVAIHVDAEPVRGYWCRESLRRALENLVGNALKYGNDGSPVCVKVERDGLRIKASVHNQGELIPVEEMESIFQVYHRAQSGHCKLRDGWGVGLPYARRVAESHGGSIMVTSNQEEGTCFVVDIPLDARPFIGAPTVA